MATKVEILRYMYGDSSEPVFFNVATDKDGKEYVAKWNSDVLGPQPSDAAIAAKNAEATAAIQAQRNKHQQEQDEVQRLKALPLAKWTDADVKSAVQIWISRQ